MLKAKVPDFIYCTFKEKNEGYYDENTKQWVITKTYPFAFIHPHEPTKATDAKRKKTQLDLAYGSWSSYEIVDGIVYEKRYCHEEKKHIVNPAKYQPVVLQNVALEGFKLDRVTSRYSTNNKLYLVEDPRRFVTEITAANLLQILLEGAVSKGVIQGKCKWLANKQLILVKDEE